LMNGVSAMKDYRKGKLTLRSYNVEPTALPAVNAKSPQIPTRSTSSSEISSARRS
jgi:hypothetical protein